MKSLRWILVLLMAFLISLLTVGVSLADDDDDDKDRRGKSYSLTITNLTQRQTFSPPLVISHTDSFELFKIGMEPGDGLIDLAENGSNATLMAMLGTRNDVFDFRAGGGPVGPGQSMTIDIQVRGKARYLSVAGMLVATNDAFFALKGLRLKGDKMKRTRVVAYDAGSEANNELCTHVPALDCEDSSGVPFFSNDREPEVVAPFVHVHNGIHGVGDLNEHNMDWRNPVAMISIKKMVNDDD